MEIICQYAGVNSHVSAGLSTQWAGQLMNSQHHSTESIKQLASPLGSTPRHHPLPQTTRWHRWSKTKQRRDSLCTKRDPFQEPFMQQIGEIWPCNILGLLFYWWEVDVTVSEIRFMALCSPTNMVNIKHTIETFSQGINQEQRRNPGTACYFGELANNTLAQWYDENKRLKNKISKDGANPRLHIC